MRKRYDVFVRATGEMALHDATAEECASRFGFASAAAFKQGTTKYKFGEYIMRESVIERFEVKDKNGETLVEDGTISECMEKMHIKSVRGFRYAWEKSKYHSDTLRKFCVRQISGLRAEHSKEVKISSDPAENADREKNGDGGRKTEAQQMKKKSTWIREKDHKPDTPAWVWVCLDNGEVKQDRYNKKKAGKMRVGYFTGDDGKPEEIHFVSNGWEKYPNFRFGTVMYWAPITKPEPPSQLAPRG